MKKWALWLIVLAAVLTIAADTPNRLQVQIFDDSGPRADIPLRLELYTYQQRRSVTVAVRWYSKETLSDAEGQAVFLVPATPDGDILRGTLWIDEIPRPVMWPGGDLRLDLHLAHIADGMEAGPFEGEQPGDDPLVVSRWSLLWSWAPALLGVALILLFLWWSLGKERRA